MPLRSLSLLALVFVLSFALQLVALLQIGVSLDPGDQCLRQRQRLFHQLAVAAALGLLLLLPLQLSAGLRQQSAAGGDGALAPGGGSAAAALAAAAAWSRQGAV
jgi:hypothetical protein